MRICPAGVTTTRKQRTLPPAAAQVPPPVLLLISKTALSAAAKVVVITLPRPLKVSVFVKTAVVAAAPEDATTSDVAT